MKNPITLQQISNGWLVAYPPTQTTPPSVTSFATLGEALEFIHACESQPIQQGLVVMPTDN